MSARHRHAKERARFWQWSIPHLGACLSTAGALSEAARRACNDVMRADLAEALDQLHRLIAFDSRDWSMDRRYAMIYAIVIGWSEAWQDVAKQHGWSADILADFARLHAAINAHKGQHREEHP